jgi:hypothetical protein
VKLSALKAKTKDYDTSDSSQGDDEGGSHGDDSGHELEQLEMPELAADSKTTRKKK